MGLVFSYGLYDLDMVCYGMLSALKNLQSLGLTVLLDVYWGLT